MTLASEAALARAAATEPPAFTVPETRGASTRVTTAARSAQGVDPTVRRPREALHQPGDAGPQTSHLMFECKRAP